MLLEDSARFVSRVSDGDDLHEVLCSSSGAHPLKVMSLSGTKPVAEVPRRLACLLYQYDWGIVWV